MRANSFDLDTPLLEFGQGDDYAAWTMRNAMEGVQIFGGIGSGKTSGSGRCLAHKYLLSNFGGLVLTAKADEKDLWLQYCKETGRLDDVIIVEPFGKNHFNFLEYESSTDNLQKSLTTNIVQVLKTVIRASEEKTKGKNDDPFWEVALDMLIANTIDLCLLAYGKVSIPLLYDIAQTIPRKDDILSEDEENPTAFMKAFWAARHNILEQVKNLQKSWSEEDVELSSQVDEETFNMSLRDNLPDVRTFDFVSQFFLENFRNISEKTRAIIEFSFSGFLFNLLREPLYSLFCNQPSNFTPKNCLEGKIIIINLPVKLYHKAGRDSQILFKYVWQRAMEMRNVQENGRPVFLWADEAQHFLHEYDAEYQATARSSRIATVYLSQNLPNYYANMGGEKTEYKVKSFLGTLATKIFHANADIETNSYASQLFGDAYTEKISTSITVAGNFGAGQNKDHVLEKVVRPELFGRLKTGGPENKFKVQGYIHVQGKLMEGEFNFRKISFRQT